MFTTFSLFFVEQWSWHDLPCQLTKGAYMTLDTSSLELDSVDTMITISTEPVGEASTSAAVIIGSTT